MDEMADLSRKAETGFITLTTDAQVESGLGSATAGASENLVSLDQLRFGSETKVTPSTGAPVVNGFGLQCPSGPYPRRQDANKPGGNTSFALRFTKG